MNPSDLNPSATAQAARLSPTAFDINIPKSNGIFTNTDGTGLYHFNNGKITNYDYVNSIIPDNEQRLQLGNYGAQMGYAKGVLKNKYGIDLSSLPKYNMGDLQQKYGDMGMSSRDLSMFETPQTATTTGTETLNNTQNTLGVPASTPQAQTQALQGQAAQPLQTPEQLAEAQAAAKALGLGNVAQAGQTLGLTQSLQGGTPPSQTGATGTTGTNPDTGQTYSQTGTAASTGGTTSSDTGKTSTGGNGNSSTGNSYQDLLNILTKSLTPTSQETDAQNQLLTLQQQGRNLSLGQQGQNNALENQPIALPFITGQKESLAKDYALQQGTNQSQQQTLQQQLANLQSRRQASIDVAKTGLEYGKPIALPYGGSLVSQSGQVLNAGAFGNTGGGTGINPSTGLKTNASTSDILGYLVSNGIDPNRYNIPALVNAVQNGAVAQDIISGRVDFAAQKAAGTVKGSVTKDAFGNIVQVTPTIGGQQVGGGSSGASSGGYQAGMLTKLLQSQGKPIDDASLANLYKQIGGQGQYVNDPTHNAQIYSALTGSHNSGSGGGTTSFPAADAASLKQQQTYADATQRAFNTANQNLQAIIPYMQQAGINTTSNVPILNALTNKMKAGLLDPGAVAAYKAALAGLRAEYAQVLSRGGEVTEGQRHQASDLIPENLTPAQLQQVATRLNIEGSNAVKEAQGQIQIIKNRVNGVNNNPVGYRSFGGGSSGGTNPLGI